MSLAAFFSRAAEPTPTAPNWTIEVHGRAVPVELRRSPRARRLTLRADAVRGCVRMTLPARMAAARAQAFLDQHREWVAVRVRAWPAAQPFVPGARLPLEGADVEIDWARGRPRTVQLEDGRLIAGGPAEGLADRIERFLKARALAVLDAETRAVAAVLGKPVTRVSVRDTASRWGSCTSGGAISYSWRLILMPPHVRASIVAHEVAHLAHLDHSPAFHALADRLSPHHATARRWLKRHGAGVHWVGRS